MTTTFAPRRTDGPFLAELARRGIRVTDTTAWDP